MKRFLSFLIIALAMCVALVSCDNHLPRGVLIDKTHHKAHTTHCYNPTTHTIRTLYHPESWTFTVQCDSCGREHTCHVEKAVFDKYQIGDTLTAKGYYHGEKGN